MRNQFKNEKKVAFTLAEVLITLAIVGVVAALTIPPLMKNTKNTENISAWKKLYSEVSSAWIQVVRDNGGIGGGMFSSTGETLNDNYGALMAAKLNFVKKCPAVSTPNTGANPCWHDANEWFTLNKISVNSNYAGTYTAILPSGAYFSQGAVNANCTQAQQCMYFTIDVNGEKGPNVMGKDIFYGSGWGDGKVIPHNLFRDPANINDDYCCRETSAVNSTNVGQGCSRLALYCSDIDYKLGKCK